MPCRSYSGSNRCLLVSPRLTQTGKIIVAVTRCVREGRRNARRSCRTRSRSCIADIPRAMGGLVMGAAIEIGTTVAAIAIGTTAATTIAVAAIEIGITIAAIAIEVIGITQIDEGSQTILLGDFLHPLLNITAQTIIIAQTLNFIGTFHRLFNNITAQTIIIARILNYFTGTHPPPPQDITPIENVKNTPQISAELNCIITIFLKRGQHTPPILRFEMLTLQKIHM